MTSPPRLRVVHSADDSPPHAADTAPDRAGSDVGFLASLVALNAVPLVALATGHFRGFAACGLSAAMTLLLARQLTLDVVASWRSRRGRNT